MGNLFDATMKFAKTTKTAILTSLPIITIIAGLTGCSGGKGGAGAEKSIQADVDAQILKIGNGNEPQGLDPHMVTGVIEHRLITSLLEGLVGEDPMDLSPINDGAAESWDISEDLKTYTFHLRPEAKWSNGDPVTSEDFVQSYKRMLTPELASEYAYMLHVVVNAREYNEAKITDFSQVGFEAPDLHTLIVKLNNPTPYFLSLLTHYSWFPVHIPTVAKHGPVFERGSKWTRQGNFVGNGPFNLKEWSPNEVIIVEKSPTYWDAESVRLNEIHYLPIESETTEERNFRAGKLHVTYTLPLTKIPVYKKENPELLRIDDYLATYFYRINVTRPPLNDVRVRQALTMSIDRESIVENIMKGGQKPALSLLPPNTAGYTSKHKQEQNFEKARELLAAAGFPNGEGFPSIELLYNTLEQHRTIAEAIQQMWKQNLNINVELVNQEWKVYLDTQKNLNYDICRAGWTGDYVDPNTFMDMWYEGGGNNDTGWVNKEYEALVDQAARTADNAARLDLFQQAEKILLEESPIIPIYYYTRFYAIDPVVKGWHPTIFNHHPWKHLYMEASTSSSGSAATMSEVEVKSTASAEAE